MSRSPILIDNLTLAFLGAGFARDDNGLFRISRPVGVSSERAGIAGFADGE